MFRCFLTGVEIGIESAYVLNRTVLYRVIGGLKEKTATLERLLEQLGVYEEVIVRKAAGQPPVTKKRRRLVSKAVAEVLRAGFSEPDLFIPFTTWASRTQGRPMSHLANHPLFGASICSASVVQLENAVRLAQEITMRIDPQRSLPNEIVSTLQAGVCLVLNDRETDGAVRAIASALESDESCVAIGVPASLVGSFREALAPLFAAMAAQEAPQAVPEP